MDWFKKNILPSMTVTILLAIAGGIWQIYTVIQNVPDKFEQNKVTDDRQDELIQQLLDKQNELDKRILILETKLSK